MVMGNHAEVKWIALANISVSSMLKLLQVLKSTIGITNNCKLIVSNTTTGNDRLPFVSRLISYIASYASYDLY